MHPAAIISFVIGALQTIVWACIAVFALRGYILPMFRKEAVTHEPHGHPDTDPDGD